MCYILQILGYGWAAIGLYNFVTVNSLTPGNETIIVVSLIMHGMLYWFPGLIIGALGSIMARKKERVVT